MTDPLPEQDPLGAVNRCRRILAALPADSLFAVDDADAGIAARHPCRISPEPFLIPQALARELESHGRLWLGFLRASQGLYLKSLRGDAPGWVAEYLNLGKPHRILDFARMNRFKNQFPVVLRPDLILTRDGPVACEFDSVPGGIGLLACLERTYEKEGFSLAGGGMIDGFVSAMEYAADARNPSLAIVVSEESRMYRPEMIWLAEALRARGLPCQAVAPGQVSVDGQSGRLRAEGIDASVDVIYRFFELFDLENVPGAHQLLEAAKLKRVRMTPPPKANLEEKLLFALLHHPALEEHWARALGERDLHVLRRLVIPTWVLDPRPVPPHAEIAGFRPAGRPAQSWEALTSLSQRQRDMVLKPSGFSPEAWGSHAVHFGSDMSQEDWAAKIREALDRFPTGPWILQPHRHPALSGIRYYDEIEGAVREMSGRVRLCPYYFVTGEDSVSLGGVLATVCPPDRKAVHGMPEAVMVPAWSGPS